MDRKRIKADDAVQDIRSGMTNTEIMEKYGLSSEGLEDLFHKLVSAGLMEAGYIQARFDLLQKGKGPSWKCPNCGARQSKKPVECPACGIIVSNFRQGHRRTRNDPTQRLSVPSREPGQPEKVEGKRSKVGGSTSAVPVWKCPACGTPQDKTYEECPDCGIVVSKYRPRPEVRPSPRNKTWREDWREKSTAEKVAFGLIIAFVSPLVVLLLFLLISVLGDVISGEFAQVVSAPKTQIGAPAEEVEKLDGMKYNEILALYMRKKYGSPETLPGTDNWKWIAYFPEGNFTIVVDKQTNIIRVVWPGERRPNVGLP